MPIFIFSMVIPTIRYYVTVANEMKRQISKNKKMQF